jgi:putative endopeptidase
MKWNKALVLGLGFAVLEMVAVGSAAPPVAPAAPAATAAPLEAGVSSLIAPGEDFFAFANGEWLDNTQIPAGRARWGARDEINSTTRQQVAAVVAGAVAHRADDTERKIADFYTAYLDQNTLESRGLTPLAASLGSIGKLRDRRALAQWLGSNLRADVDPLNFGGYSSNHVFGLAVDYGIHGEAKHFAYLLQGGLGLPSREAYLADSAEAREQRARYQQYIARLLGLAGLKRSRERAAAVLTLETALARVHATDEESAKETNADNHWQRAEFAARAPGLDWEIFFSAAGLAGQESFVAWQPAAIAGTAALLGSEPLSAWQDYLRVRLLARYAEVLPQKFAQAPAQTPRAELALQATNRLLPLAVGRLYVEKHFPFEEKANVQAILANVLDSFRRRLEAATWMTPASKSKAQAKLNALYFGVGYPDSWPDDTSLAIDPRDALGNVQRIAEWNYRAALTKLGRPTDWRDWGISPQSAMAALNFLRNAYNFSAGLLQAPKYDATASEAANYGAIGAIFGHEITHFVDTLGADYDERGALDRWWTEADAERYAAARLPLELQFSAYRPFPEIAINGRLTAVENVADLAGLSAAFDAYRRMLGSRAANADYLRQQDRQFFIGFARAWRVKFTEEGLRAQSVGNDHAPENFRVSTVRNFDAWHEAFDVRPGQPLYLPPGVRVRVW